GSLGNPPAKVVTLRRVYSLYTLSTLRTFLTLRTFHAGVRKPVGARAVRTCIQREDAVELVHQRLHRTIAARAALRPIPHAARAHRLVRRSAVARGECAYAAAAGVPGQAVRGV